MHHTYFTFTFIKFNDKLLLYKSEMMFFNKLSIDLLLVNKLENKTEINLLRV